MLRGGRGGREYFVESSGAAMSEMPWTSRTGIGSPASLTDAGAHEAAEAAARRSAAPPDRQHREGGHEAGDRRRREHGRVPELDGQV